MCLRPRYEEARVPVTYSPSGEPGNGLTAGDLPPDCCGRRRSAYFDGTMTTAPPTPVTQDLDELSEALDPTIPASRNSHLLLAT